MSNEINGAHASSIGQVAGDGHNANGPISAAHSVAGCLGWGAPRADGDRPRLKKRPTLPPARDVVEFKTVMLPDVIAAKESFGALFHFELNDEHLGSFAALTPIREAMTSSNTPPMYPSSAVM